MANKRENTEQLTRVQPPAGTPSYLTKYVAEDTSLEQVKEYRILPRIKIVQAMSGEDYKTDFDEGDVIVNPGGILLSKYDKKAKKGKPFLIVPVFAFTEFCLWSDRRDKASPMIQDRSFDKTSMIAARARNPKARFEVYGDPKVEKPLVRRYVEHINFASFIYGDDNADKGLLVGLSFSRGEFGRGKRFCTDLSHRHIPTWSQVWAFQPGFRDMGDKKWYGLDHIPPTEENPYGPAILEKEVEFFHAQYEEFGLLMAARKLGVADEAPEEVETIPDIDAKM